jgi:hypothetical protein
MNSETVTAYCGGFGNTNEEICRCQHKYVAVRGVTQTLKSRAEKRQVRRTRAFDGKVAKWHPLGSASLPTR